MGRSVVEVLREGGRVRVVLRGERSLPGAAFLLLWLAGWAFGESIVLERIFLAEAFEASAVFLALWLVLWTLAGALAFRALLWNLWGREELWLEEGFLRHAQKPLGRPRSIPLGEVRGVREVRTPGRGGHRLQVESQGPELRLGTRLDDAAVARVLAALEGRVPVLPPLDEPPPPPAPEEPPGAGGG